MNFPFHFKTCLLPASLDRTCHHESRNFMFVFDFRAPLLYAGLLMLLFFGGGVFKVKKNRYAFLTRATHVGQTASWAGLGQ